MVESLTKERDAALESMRLLLVENTDLKNSLKRLGGL
nr:MAG TPA: optinuerin [Caudoviricetes sp.]